ncbi:MAG: iron-sulfur cluster biosynthesis transcriptional regulator SufR [Cyanobacteria bacterium WB6_1B_304]|jgi:DeoR family suf operon transcriptional repressor|nr:iron-sulfur cluster biosynthesis transcriptional regulator SufR [Cyanobacteria bacterium WB6_1B_304]
MSTIQHPSSKRDILQLLLKQGRATAQSLADALQISPQAIRRHLKDLEEDELIIHHATTGGTGRPQYTYQLSPKGRNHIPWMFHQGSTDSYGDFALSLMDTLADTIGTDQMGSILQKQWEKKAVEYRNHLGNGTLQERVANLVALRQLEGYMAEWYAVDPNSDHNSSSVHRSTGSQFIITEYNCAIHDIVESFPSVCSHELEMFAMALGCTVKRTHWLVHGEHRCGYLIQERERF